MNYSLICSSQSLKKKANKNTRQAYFCSNLLLQPVNKILISKFNLLQIIFLKNNQFFIKIPLININNSKLKYSKNNNYLTIIIIIWEKYSELRTTI